MQSFYHVLSFLSYSGGDTSVHCHPVIRSNILSKRLLRRLVQRVLERQNVHLHASSLLRSNQRIAILSCLGGNAT